MSTLKLNNGIGLRGGTAENLTSENPIPKAREIMIETDTRKIKIGDGISHWNSLDYVYGNLDSETWTFELEDGSIITKNIAILNKKPENKYKILKNGTQVAELTMAQLVEQVQSGEAEENYGIGAQLIVPYKDPYNAVTYELPFNFGLFMDFGEQNNRLYLQADKAVPATTNLQYGKTDVSAEIRSSIWQESLAREWLNGTFLKTIPEEFVNVMITTSRGQWSYGGPDMTEDKIFLIGATGSCASRDKYYPDATNTNKYILIDSYNGEEFGIWKYWEDKIGTPQAYNTTNEARIVYRLDGTAADIPLPNIVHDYTDPYGDGTEIPYNGCFSSTGKYTTIHHLLPCSYLPACVIG